MPLSFWIKERSNPQIGTYYVGLGQLSKRKAKEHEKSLYGNNRLIRFDSRKAYMAECRHLKITS